MAEFGVRLKEARMQRGISLRQIATATKISMSALEALERNDFSRLPGGIFSRAFVRAYALEVGLDPEETVQDFLEEYERHGDAAAEQPMPEVTAEDRAFLERQRRAARWLRGVSIGLVLGLAGIAIWRLAPSRSDDDSGSSKSSSPEAGASPAPPQAAAPAPAPSPPRTAAPATAAAPTPSSGNSTPATSNAPLEADGIGLRLEVTADCWVRATVDGNVQVERTLKPGEAHDIGPGRDVYLQVGNAGAVKWSINGRPARALGPSGATAAVRITRETIQKYLQ